jgi:hypothetical protein
VRMAFPEADGRQSLKNFIPNGALRHKVAVRSGGVSVQP